MTIPTALLTPAQTADILQMSPKTLANLRYLGKGPRYIKMGRTVRYSPTDIKDYLVSSTVEAVS